MRGERRQVKLDRLGVADVGEHRGEERQDRALPAGHVEPGLGEQGGQADRLERHRLAAHVRAAHEQDARRRAKLERGRHDPASRRGRVGVAACVAPQERMPGPRQTELFAAGDHRGRRARHRARQPHARPQEVGRGQRILACPERVDPAPDEVRQGAQHAPDLGALAGRELGQRVVERAHLERLDEQGRPARRNVVDQPLRTLEAVGPHGDHEAVAPLGDERALLGGQAPVAVELLAQPGTLDVLLLAQRGQLGAGAVEHPAVGVHRQAQALLELRVPDQSLGQPGRVPRLLARLLPPARRAPAGREELGHLEEAARSQGRAQAQLLGDLVDQRERRRAGPRSACLGQALALEELGQRALHLRGVGRGNERARPRGGRRRAGEPGEPVDDLRELEELEDRRRDPRRAFHGGRGLTRNEPGRGSALHSPAPQLSPGTGRCGGHADRGQASTRRARFFRLAAFSLRLRRSEGFSKC